MDYLDPKKKKSHLRRLYLGYLLMGIAIGLATLILVYVGTGYVPTEDGLVQNSLLYIDSTPRGVNVELNGQRQRGQTDARYVVPGAAYDIRLSKDNYRPWVRTIQLGDGKVRRIAYPRLYPVSLRTNVTFTGLLAPDMVSGSLDRRYILVHFPDQPLRLELMNTESPYSPRTMIDIPAGLVKSPAEAAKYEVIEWTEDSRKVLLKRISSIGNEYVLIDNEDVARVISLTKDLNLAPDAELSLRDRAFDRYVVFSPSLGTVSFVDYGNPAGPQIKAQGVIKQVSFENDKVLFITQSPNDPDKVVARLLEGDRTYNIREIKKSDKYLLEMAKFGRSLVLIVGSAIEQRAFVYRNPASYLRSNPGSNYPVATTAMRVDNPQFASFSSDASVAIVYGDKQFASHEFEADQSYSYKIDIDYDTTKELRWMDGSRLNLVSDDNVYSMDFDGSNLEKLVAGRADYGVYFDRNYENLFSFLVNKEGNLFQSTSTSLKAE